MQSAPGQALAELAWAGKLPHRKLGVTTVGEIRAAGFDVVPTSGRGFHATVVVPGDWGIEDARVLAAVFRSATNPSPRR